MLHCSARGDLVFSIDDGALYMVTDSNTIGNDIKAADLAAITHGSFRENIVTLDTAQCRPIRNGLMLYIEYRYHISMHANSPVSDEADGISIINKLIGNCRSFIESYGNIVMKIGKLVSAEDVFDANKLSQLDLITEDIVRSRHMDEPAKFTEGNIIFDKTSGAILMVMSMHPIIRTELGNLGNAINVTDIIAAMDGGNIDDRQILVNPEWCLPIRAGLMNVIERQYNVDNGRVDEKEVQEINLVNKLIDNCHTFNENYGKIVEHVCLYVTPQDLVDVSRIGILNHVVYNGNTSMNKKG